MSSSATSLKPLIVEDLFSQEAKRLQNASLSGLASKFAGIPDVVGLHVGLPPPASFPLSGIHLDLATPAPNSAADQPENHTKPRQVNITGSAAVLSAQQYGFSAGYAPLLSWVTETMQAAHKPQVPISCAITSGAVHALSLATSMMVNPGDWIVMDEFTYSHALEVVFMPKGARLLPVRMDSHGMDPHHLHQQLAWAHEQFKQGFSPDDGLPPPSRPPRLVYLVPTGHNPTGITMSLSRKQEIYQVCRQHDLLILEDDAYWWLYWGDKPPTSPSAPHSTLHQEATTEGHSTSGNQVVQGTSPGVDSGSHVAWHDELPRSFLSMDVDGRVLRVDTLAKVLGPGFRVGWVTGPPSLVDKLALAVQASSVGTCPLAQVVVWELISSWGTEGWSQHLTQLKQLYSRKAAALERACAEHLNGLVKYQGGGDDGNPEVPADDQLSAALLKSRVVVVPGAMAWADLTAVKERRPCPYLRLTFAFLDESQLEEGVKRLATALRDLHQ